MRLRYAGAVVTVSIRALIILCELLTLCAHVGTRPQRNRRASAAPFGATIASPLATQAITSVIARTPTALAGIAYGAWAYRSWQSASSNEEVCNNLYKHFV